MNRKDKKYVVYKETSEGTTRVELTEDQLTEAEYGLFLGNLIKQFNAAPPKTKIEFMNYIDTPREKWED
jgi:hypothetical protein